MHESRRWRLTLIAAVLLAAAPASGSLSSEVRTLIESSDLKGAAVGVSIRDAASGDRLVSIGDEQAMIPASNMKLLTTGAALYALGPDFEFATRLLRDGDRLVVVGDGDPAFADPNLLSQMSMNGVEGLDLADFLRLWTDAVVATGLTHVREVAVDDRVFDRQFIHESWPRDQLNRRYCAEVAGLNVHLNVLWFYPEPRPGTRPLVSTIRPRADWLGIVNRATSATGLEDANTVWITRPATENRFTVRGNVRFAYRTPVAVTIHDAPAFFARLLAERLRESGVDVGASRVCAETDDPSTGTTVGPIITTPIATVVTRCNTDSQNLYAEALLKRMGHAMTKRPGSWVTGTAILRHVMNVRLGAPDLIASLRIADGSGLSRDNRVSARTMTAWLATFGDDDPLGSTFRDSLAIVGETGTLRTRMAGIDLRGATVRAKTGYINQVSCLSGFVAMPDGRRRAFSVLVNGLTEPVSKAKRLQDRIVGVIAGDMARAVAHLGGD